MQDGLTYFLSLIMKMFFKISEKNLIYILVSFHGETKGVAS